MKRAWRQLGYALLFGVPIATAAGCRGTADDFTGVWSAGVLALCVLASRASRRRKRASATSCGVRRSPPGSLTARGSSA